MARCTGSVRVAVIAESFLPSKNGVTSTILHTLEHLQRSGHSASVVAAAPTSDHMPAVCAASSICWLPSSAVPGYPTFRVSAPGVARMRGVLRRMQPDVVHLAAPFVLGWDAVRAANQLDLPTVAIYQTDVPGFAARYGLRPLGPMLWRRIRNVHQLANRTLAPSLSAAAQLRRHGVPRLHLWERGVDTDLFRPDRRSAQVRTLVGKGSEVLVGFVGRLAAEKQVEDLRVLDGIRGVQLVVVGDGPMRSRLERWLPTAVFTGWLDGPALAYTMASLDMVIHTGEQDTFGQTVQEAMASGVPVIAVAKGGPADLVRHGRTGLLYPANRLDVLRTLVGQLASSEKDRRSMGAAARAVVLTRSWSRRCDELLDHYRQAMSPGDSNAPVNRFTMTDSAVARYQAGE